MGDLRALIAEEGQNLEKHYLWLESHMPKAFFEELEPRDRLIVAQGLMHGLFTHFHLKTHALVLCFDSPDADIQILKHAPCHQITSYRSFASRGPLPGLDKPLRVGVIRFNASPFPIEKRLIEEAGKEDICHHTVSHNAIQLAWRNPPKSHFFYSLAKMVHRHHFAIKQLKAGDHRGILALSLELEGKGTLTDLLKEMTTRDSYDRMEKIEEVFVDSGLLSGNWANLIEAVAYFIHQALLHADLNLYSLPNIEEGLCRHPELLVHLIQAFDAKFNPEKHDLKAYAKLRSDYLHLVDQIDTGYQLNDTRRKNILKQALNFVDFVLKTNFYAKDQAAFCFRLDPIYLDHVPFDRKEKFPELPYAIFFMKGAQFIGFHVRFRNLSRGGLRTVYPQRLEQMLVERNNVFAECYHLAYTQNKKNKDIPEGGAKGVIFLSSPQLEIESLYQAQRGYVTTLLSLVNCEDDGRLKTKEIIDYWKKPEYIYLGPDENMHNPMLEWIAAYSIAQNYKPQGAFISSKPGAGINHKEYGVTSLGVNVYMEELLKFLGIDPRKDPFTLKISGGPDGDVAGNQLLNLYRFYPKTAKLLSLIDVSGTIHDPEGLDLAEMAKLFGEAKPIRFYPPAKLHDGGFLLDLKTKREESAYAQQTLCWRKSNGKLTEEWLSGNEMNHLLRSNIHQTPTDIFITGGGRPRTLNENNYKEFLDPHGKPSSRGIVEGANLYLTPWARRALEKLGVLIIKDSSANKGGVICSSFEVLTSLVLSEQEFLAKKSIIVPEILTLIAARAKDEAQLLLHTHTQTKAFLTEISEQISEKINALKDALLQYLHPLTLSHDLNDPLIRSLIAYCPPILRDHYRDRILTHIPDVHKKAIIACYIASHLIYKKGLSWTPTVEDALKSLPLE